jgi:hypothetical protein
LTGSFLFNEPTAELSSPLTVHGFGSKFGLLDDGEEAWEGVKRRVSGESRGIESGVPSFRSRFGSFETINFEARS